MGMKMRRRQCSAMDSGRDGEKNKPVPIVLGEQYG
jgi:hypothetical protein